MPLQHSIWVTPVINIYLKQSLVSAGRHQTDVSNIFSWAFPTPATASRQAAAGTPPCFMNKPPRTWTRLPLRQEARGPSRAVLTCAWSSTQLCSGSSLHFASRTSEMKLISLETMWHLQPRLDPHTGCNFSPKD